MSDGFDQPESSGTWFKPADYNGSLILVTKVHGIDRHFDTLKDAEVDRAEFDFVDLDDGVCELQQNMYDTHIGIVNKLKTALRKGNGVLGVVGQAPASRGNSPAWILKGYDENGNHAQRATAWLEANKNPKFSQPDTEHANGAATSGARAQAPAQPSQAAPVATRGQDGATGAGAPAAGGPYTFNGVELDKEQYDKLVSIGIIKPEGANA